MDNKNKFKDIKQIILDGNSDQKEQYKKSSEDLLIKYINEINDFKKRIEEKYHNNGINNVSFSIQSSYTWLGDDLEIKSNYGDKMSIFEENDPIIEYDEIDINNPKEEIQLEIYQTETIFDQFKGKIYKNNDGYYLELKPKYEGENHLTFNTIQELLDFYCERDEIHQNFDHYGSFLDSDRSIEYEIR